MKYETNIDINLLDFAVYLGNCATDDEVCSFMTRLMQEIPDTPLNDKIINVVKSFEKE